MKRFTLFICFTFLCIFSVSCTKRESYPVKDFEKVMIEEDFLDEDAKCVDTMTSYFSYEMSGLVEHNYYIYDNDSAIAYNKHTTRDGDDISHYYVASVYKVYEVPESYIQPVDDNDPNTDYWMVASDKSNTHYRVPPYKLVLGYTCEIDNDRDNKGIFKAPYKVYNVTKVTKYEVEPSLWGLNDYRSADIENVEVFDYKKH